MTLRLFISQKCKFSVQVISGEITSENFQAMFKYWYSWETHKLPCVLNIINILSCCLNGKKLQKTTKPKDASSFPHFHPRADPPCPRIPIPQLYQNFYHYTRHIYKACTFSSWNLTASSKIWKAVLEKPVLFPSILRTSKGKKFPSTEW